MMIFSDGDSAVVLVIIIIYLFGIAPHPKSFVALQNILLFKTHKKIYVYNKTNTNVSK